VGVRVGVEVTVEVWLGTGVGVVLLVGGKDPQADKSKPRQIRKMAYIV
jgi:hypothetical protein